MPQTDTWITIAEADVQNSINDSELEANLGIAQASGQTAAAIITAIIADVSAEIAGYCRAVGPIGPAGTIPQELKNAAIDIILYRVCGRVSGATAANARKKSHDDAMAVLAKVPTRLFFISSPVTLGTTSTAVTIPSIQPRPSEGFGYRKERGF